MGDEPNIGRNHDHAGAPVCIGERRGRVSAILWNFFTYWNAGDAQIGARAIIALHQHADRERASLRFDFARGRADAALEFVTDHSGTATHIALFDGARFRGVDFLESVLRVDVEAVDVFLPAVPAFRDARTRPPVAGGVGLAVRHTPLNDAGSHDSNAVRP